MQVNEKVKRILDVLKDKKAIDVLELKVDELTILADFMIICSGTSVTHVKALADELLLKVKNESGFEFLKVEGYNTARWILIDFGDIVVHIFHREEREFYNLEKLWRDGIIDAEDLSEIHKNFNTQKIYGEDTRMSELDNLNNLEN